jgi:hypothetical protein
LGILIVSINGGNTHTMRHARVRALQELVLTLGAEGSPLFLRLGGSRQQVLQPVSSRALLREVEAFLPRLRGFRIPGISLHDGEERSLGTVYPNSDGFPAGEGKSFSLWAASGGIRLTTTVLPPPAGFRSHGGLPRGVHECYFERLERTDADWKGYRAPEMRPGAPVSLAEVPVPPPTRWDVARTAGAPDVRLLRYVEVPANEVFGDLLHVLESACLESLRLKQALTIRTG